MKKLLIIALLVLSSCSSTYIGYRHPHVNTTTWSYRPYMGNVNTTTWSYRPYMGNVYSDHYLYYNRRPAIIIYKRYEAPRVTPRNYSAQPNRGRSNQNRLRTPNKN
jgi:hypothetical protein